MLSFLVLIQKGLTLEELSVVLTTPDGLLKHEKCLSQGTAADSRTGNAFA